ERDVFGDVAGYDQNFGRFPGVLKDFPGQQFTARGTAGFLLGVGSVTVIEAEEQEDEHHAVVGEEAGMHANLISTLDPLAHPLYGTAPAESISPPAPLLPRNA